MTKQELINRMDVRFSGKEKKVFVNLEFNQLNKENTKLLNAFSDTAGYTWEVQPRKVKPKQAKQNV